MKVHTLVVCEPTILRATIVIEVKISFGAVQSILTDILGMSKVSARWVPRMSVGQKPTSTKDL